MTTQRRKIFRDAESGVPVPEKVFVPDQAAESVQFYNYERIGLKNGLAPFEVRSKAV